MEIGFSHDKNISQKNDISKAVIHHEGKKGKVEERINISKLEIKVAAKQVQRESFHSTVGDLSRNKNLIHEFEEKDIFTR